MVWSNGDPSKCADRCQITAVAWPTQILTVLLHYTVTSLRFIQKFTSTIGWPLSWHLFSEAFAWNCLCFCDAKKICLICFIISTSSSKHLRFTSDTLHLLLTFTFKSSESSSRSSLITAIDACIDPSIQTQAQKKAKKRFRQIAGNRWSFCYSIGIWEMKRTTLLFGLTKTAHTSYRNCTNDRPTRPANSEL